MPEELQNTAIADQSRSSILSEEDLDACFNRQAQKAWDRYEMLSEINSGELPSDKNGASALDPKALNKLKRYWDENKDQVVS
ncbi:MAG: hypothetical protein ABIH39_06805 [Candidatus Margulisiibacteriota bacterium]